MKFSATEYKKFSRPRYGKANPERIDNPLWLAAITGGETAYQIRMAHDDTKSGEGVGSGLSSYRELQNGPVWTWERFGRSTTKLPDGRLIHIGGEHEDWYDLDFCIYNDVVVEHPDGSFEIYGYPMDVFLPTDFHTATLIGHTIWIVGALGYRDLRKFGDTQVYTLDTRSFEIMQVQTGAGRPGWLHRHWAEPIGETEIVIGGGGLLERDEDGTEVGKDNGACFVLDVSSRTWRKLDQAGPAMLGLSPEDYLRLKSPRFGTVNPERIENRFWSAMAQRSLLPRRARDLFGDYGCDPTEEERKALKSVIRPIDEIVWTSVREDPAEIELDDGRRITLGGAYDGYGRDEIDNWVYTDAILMGPDGAMEFYLYPPDVLPALHSLHVTRHAGRIFISGTPDRTLSAHWPQFRSILLELNLDTFALRRIGSTDNNPDDMIVGPGRLKQGTASQLIFPIIHRWKGDPVRVTVLDLDTEAWSMHVIEP